MDKNAMDQNTAVRCLGVALDAKRMWIEQALQATVPPPGGENKGGFPVAWDQVFLRYANVADTIAENIKEIADQAARDQAMRDVAQAPASSAGSDRDDRRASERMEAQAAVKRMGAQAALIAIARMMRNNSSDDPVGYAREVLDRLGIAWEPKARQ